VTTVSARKLDRAQYEVEFDSSFESEVLNTDQWIPHYLPQWSTRDQSAARYALADGMLTLRIDEDQAPWCPEFDGQLRVSSFQTGVFAGPVDSRIGQHRFRENLVVRESQNTRRLYAPHFGLVEARVKAIADARCMVALWMIGFEDIPSRSAELCVFEIFGSTVTESQAVVGVGVHPFGDPGIRDEFRKLPVHMDVTEFHTYAAEWTPGNSAFYVDDQLIATIDQAPDYPLQLMLNVYEFADVSPGEPNIYPKEYVVDFVRGYRRRTTREPAS
jgi:Glycosyl hydrolases family 16